MNEAGDGARVTPPPDGERRDTPPRPGRAAKKATTPLVQPLSHPETPDDNPRLRFILTELAQGKDIVQIASAIGHIKPEAVRRTIVQFADRYGIRPTSNDTQFSLPIRTAFAAIDLDLAFEQPILRGTERLPRLAPEVEEYFTFLDSMTPIQNKTEFLALEQRAQTSIDAIINKLGLNNIIHTAAVWKLKTKNILQQRGARSQITTAEATDQLRDDPKTILQQLAGGEIVTDAIDKLRTYCATNGIQKSEQERPDTFLIRTVFKAMTNRDIDREPLLSEVTRKRDALAGLPYVVTHHFAQLQRGTPVTDWKRFNALAEYVAKYVKSRKEELGVTDVIHAATAWRLYKETTPPNFSSDEMLTLTLRAKGYSYDEINEALYNPQAGRKRESGIRALKAAYKKLDVQSGTIAMMKLMDYGLITPEFILSGAPSPFDLSKLNAIPGSIALLEALITDAGKGRQKEYKELVRTRAHSQFSSTRAIIRLVREINNSLGIDRKDPFHAAILYAAAKKAGLISSEPRDNPDNV